MIARRASVIDRVVGGKLAYSSEDSLGRLSWRAASRRVEGGRTRAPPSFRRDPVVPAALTGTERFAFGSEVRQHRTVGGGATLVEGMGVVARPVLGAEGVVLVRFRHGAMYLLLVISSIFVNTGSR